jgi:hypothetical protein
MKRVLGPLSMALVLGGVAMAVPERAAADSDSGFRCGSGRLVGVGDRMYDVRGKCGDPAFASQRTERRRQTYRVRRWNGQFMEEVREEREVDILIDEWTYDLGSDRLIRIVSFENDRVVGVTTGSRGQKR